MRERNIITHPSYGMLSLSHPNGGERVLFGSAVKHNNTVMIRLMEGEEEREFSAYRQFPRKCLFEVEMSKAQFADFISSAGCGSGVPCTIRKRVDVDEIIPDPPFHDEKITAHKEFVARNHQVNSKVTGLINSVEQLFEKKNLTKADKQAIIATLEAIKRDIGCNTDFMMQCFVENTEKITAVAKAEIEAFFDNRLRQIANEALAQKISNGAMLDIKNPIAIEESEDMTNE